MKNLPEGEFSLSREATCRDGGHLGRPVGCAHFGAGKTGTDLVQYVRYFMIFIAAHFPKLCYLG